MNLTKASSISLSNCFTSESSMYSFIKFTQLINLPCKTKVMSSSSNPCSLYMRSYTLACRTKYTSSGDLYSFLLKTISCYNYFLNFRDVLSFFLKGCSLSSQNCLIFFQSGLLIDRKSRPIISNIMKKYTLKLWIRRQTLASIADCQLKYNNYDQTPILIH